MLAANPTWQWVFDPCHQQLTLDMDEMIFIVAAKISKLDTCVKTLNEAFFSIEDTHLYTHFSNILEQQFNFAEPILVQMALNAVALSKFHKRMGNKSWLFNLADAPSPASHEQIVMMSSNTQQGVFLLLERNQCSSLAMLLNPTLALNNGTILHQFELLRVMNDRLAQYRPINSMAFAKAQ